MNIVREAFHRLALPINLNSWNAYSSTFMHIPELSTQHFLFSFSFSDRFTSWRLDELEEAILSPHSLNSSLSEVNLRGIAKMKIRPYFCASLTIASNCMTLLWPVFLFFSSTHVSHILEASILIDTTLCSSIKFEYSEFSFVEQVKRVLTSNMY